MKVLLCHNFYRSSSPSGEDGVYLNERKLLSDGGVEVVPFERFNDDIDEKTLLRRFNLGIDTVWSRSTYDRLRRLVHLVRPDVAHFHNTFPVISPSGYAALHDLGVPVVHTLHNFRSVCPGALLYRGEGVCEECFGSSLLLPSLRHRCYRNSLPATGAVAASILFHRFRKTYRKNVTRFVALTRFAADRLVAGGLPAEKIVVKPNYLPDPPPPGSMKKQYAVYVGRLSREKGILTMLRSFSRVGNIRLKIAGSGPLSDAVKEIVERDHLPVDLLGRLSRGELQSLVGNASFQIVPSEWYEGFPMVILEAFACGTPVIASCLGSLAELITDGESGLHFQAGNSEDLAHCISFLAQRPELASVMGKNARALFERKYTAEKNLQMLMTIYDAARHAGPACS